MKTLLTVLLMMGFVSVVNANETVGEKAKATGNKASRAMKKGYNRTKEAACGKLTGDSKAECMAKKAKHRAEEMKEKGVDKFDKAKNKVD